MINLYSALYHYHSLFCNKNHHVHIFSILLNCFQRNKILERGIINLKLSQTVVEELYFCYNTKKNSVEGEGENEMRNLWAWGIVVWKI